LSDRRIFDEEHRAFRSAVRVFVERHVVPRMDDWRAAGVVDREVWLAAGKAGILAPDIEVVYGGAGVSDYRFHAIRGEEMARCGALSPAFNLHSEIVGGYLSTLATVEQKRRWLPGFCTGEQICTIAITEPDAGSDVAAIRTTAERDGDDYVLNGQKSFVTHGLIASCVLVVARTGGGATRGPSASLFLVDPATTGVKIGRNHRKIGLQALDTVEMFFSDVRVPHRDLLGQEGRAFLYLLNNLPRERLSVGVFALALAERAVAETVRYCRDRRVFGSRLRDLQAVRFDLAEMTASLRVARAFTDQCIIDQNCGELSQEDAATVKLFNSELCKDITDRCLQLHGGFGYTTDSFVGQAFVDSRVQTIYGGASEVMKEIIGQSLE
jgi:alkylation response protein AidB-like acyl-CoA dehydrogenase